MLPEEKITEIRQSVDIVSIISKYVPLTPRGKNYFGVCPFHDDNNPSMSVSTEKQIYKCFSCGATGNVFKFIMDYENVSFKQAIKQVADYAGIEVNIGNVTNVQKNSSLYQIYDISLKYYINNINTKEGKKAKEYLLNRDIDESIIKEFQIGLSLDGKDTLAKMLTKKFSSKDILESGLVGSSDYGYYDLFHSRIMFPLYDLNGEVVAYSARIYNKDDNAKYINTKETKIFKKGKLLYNYHRAKNIARQKNQIIVMEGFMDVIRAHTIDVKNVVATMGTAVTADQAHLIKKMGNEIILCFDGDEAGAKATMACADELIKIGVTPKVVRLEDNLDPDEYIKSKGKDAFINKLNNPLSTMDFKLSYLKKDKNLSTTTDQAKYINEAIAEINKIEDDVLKEITIKKLISETGIDEDLVRSKIVNKPKVKPKPKVTTKTSKYEVAQRNLLFHMLNSKEVIQMYDNKVTFMPTKEYRMLARQVSSFYKDYGFISIADLIDYIEAEEEMTNTINKIQRANLNEKYTNEEIEDYIYTIEDYNIRKETKRLKEKMKEISDPIEKAKIAQRIIDLKKENEHV